MARDDETHDDSQRVPDLPLRAEPGVVVLFSAGRPAMSAFEVGAGLEIGRGTPDGILEDDERVSRRHVRIARRGSFWHVEDLGSRNGVFVDGVKLDGSGVFESRVLVRIGRSLLWVSTDVRPFLDRRKGGEASSDMVMGALLARAYGEIALASRAGDTLCVVGESGSGKELAARAFHEARYGTSGVAPFVALNCAAIPEGLAERLLFGARKGAYSGAATDADGYIQSADQGTLFLDEIAELDLLVQAKLLRVLETREVLPLGASRPKKVTLAICVASHKRLRDEVAANRFREDLYFRVGRPEVALPPLRERLDEIPEFVARELAAVGSELTPSVTFVEAVALRPWPGNIRELLREVRRAGHRALGAGATVVEAEHLSEEAGASLGSSPPGSDAKAAAARLSDDEILRALAENGGNVRGTARALGMHRNQLRRWLDKRGEGEKVSGASTLPPDEES